VTSSAAFPVRRRIDLISPLLCGCGLAAAALYLRMVDPEQGVGLPCPLRSLTGLWCPGCGLTRATHQLLNGHVRQALRFNLLVVVVLGAIIAGWAAWMSVTLGRPTAPWRRAPRWAVAAALVAMIGFGVVRNLPWVHGLRG
jgi:Protein of unknown function (DUF2752)